MKYTAGALKEMLLSMIGEMREHPERYAKNPGKDFTRRRSLTLFTLIGLILTMDEKSVWKGLLGYFQNGIDTPSASAFAQQRKKLLPCAFEELFHRFTDSLGAVDKVQNKATQMFGDLAKRAKKTPRRRQLAACIILFRFIVVAKRRQ